MNLGASAPRLLVAVSVAAATLTILIGILPAGELAGHSPALHLAIDTAVSVIALVAGWLLLARFRESRTLGDLLLVSAFLLLLGANLCFSSIPALFGYPHGNFATWASAAGRLSGALALAAAAFWPPRDLASPRRAIVFAGTGCFALLAAIGVAVALLGDVLPAGVRAPAAGGAINGSALVANNFLVAVQLFAAFVLGSATIGFERRALRTGDQLMHWIAMACVLAGFARLNYFLAPSLYTDWVSLGDFLRASAYVCLLFGGLAEISRRAAAAAKVEERDAIARDLHDGLAQDLAFVAGRLRELATKAEFGRQRDRELFALLSSAASRALDESRVAVWSLASPDAPIEAAVEHTAEEVATREGGSVLVEAEAGLKASQAHKHAILCIVREAVTNAIRHGKPGRVEVRLIEDGGLLLEVKDNGKGFDGGRAGGFGLTTIHQRVAAFSGNANVTSTPGRGTILTVRLPAEAGSAEKDATSRSRTVRGTTAQRQDHSVQKLNV
jgi:signal transduction histidine kinase